MKKINRYIVFLLGILMSVFLMLSGFVFGPADAQKRNDSDNSTKVMHSDKELVEMLASEDKDRSIYAAREIFRRGEKIVPMLLANKGNRSPFAWGSLGNPNGGSISIAPGGDPAWEEGRIVTVEVASIYLICAIYRQDFDFGQSGYLRSKEEVPFMQYNTDERVDSAWSTVEKWIDKMESQGINSLREDKIGPLSGTKFFF